MSFFCLSIHPSLCLNIYLSICPLSVRLSNCLSVLPSVHPSVMHPYLRNHASSDHNFWYTCWMVIFPGVFFIFFEMENNVSYHRDSIAYDHDFWYTCVKWWLSGYFFFFFFFFTLILWAVRGGGKNCKKWPKMKNNYIHLSHTVSQE